MKGEDITYEYMRKHQNREISEAAEKHVQAKKSVKRGESSRKKKTGAQIVDLEAQVSLPSSHINASPIIKNEFIFESNDKSQYPLSPPCLNSSNWKS